MMDLSSLGVRVEPYELTEDTTLYVRELSIEMVNNLQSNEDGGHDLAHMAKLVALNVVTSETDLTPVEPNHNVWLKAPARVVKDLFQIIARISELNKDAEGKE